MKHLWYCPRCDWALHVVKKPLGRKDMDLNGPPPHDPPTGPIAAVDEMRQCLLGTQVCSEEAWGRETGEGKETLVESTKLKNSSQDSY